MNSKADINDIINLNDSLNLFVSKQNKINKVLGEGLNTIGDKFNILSNNITNVSEKLSELSIKVSSNTENGNKYDNKIEKLSEKHNEDITMLNDKISSLNESKEDLSNAINSKLSSDDAASIYAKKRMYIRRMKLTHLKTHLMINSHQRNGFWKKVHFKR